MKLLKCAICGNIITHVKKSGVPVMCCGRKMEELVPGTSDGAAEKHVPVIKQDGNKVVVEITDYGKRGKHPEGKVIEIIGHINDPGTDILSIVRAYDMPVEFSEKIMRQVENVSNEVSEADMAGRMDIRDWMMVTIDGEDAKDLDDAVSLRMEGENYNGN